MTLRVGSLCAGYGGLEEGVRSVLGGTIAWQSEIDPGACKILAHRYPNVPNLGDMTVVDWSAVEPVDVLCGGTPCQDLSHAGKRAGMTEGTRSNLWVAMREAIRILRPRLVVWENVRGAYSARADSELESREGRVGDGGDGPVLRALGRVLGDLSELGFDAEWVGLRAADVGAPHGRFRVFVAAWPATDSDRLGHERGGRARHGRPGPADSTVVAADTVGGGCDGRAPVPLGVEVIGAATAGGGEGASNWGPYAAAINRWERVLGRLAPPPTELSAKGSPRLSPRFVEFLMGLPAGWVTDVPGLTRNEMLKALGNGVVPAQAAHALRLLLADVPA